MPKAIAVTVLAIIARTVTIYTNMILLYYLCAACRHATHVAYVVQLPSMKTHLLTVHAVCFGFWCGWLLRRPCHQALGPWIFVAAPPQQRRKQRKCCREVVLFLFYPFISHTSFLTRAFFALPGPGPNFEYQKSLSCCYLPLGHGTYNAQGVAHSYTMLHH